MNFRRISARGAAALAVALPALGFGLQGALPASADSTITVTSTADHAVVAGDCTGTTTITCATLRSALKQANAVTTGVTTISLPAGTIKIASVPAGDTSGDAGDFHVDSNVNIVGQGRGVTFVDGNDNDRVFDVRCGFMQRDTTVITATFSDLTIQHGHLTNSSLMTNQDGSGAGICSTQPVKINRVDIRGNTADNAIGGGLATLGDNARTEVNDSSFINNKAAFGAAFTVGSQTLFQSGPLASPVTSTFSRDSFSNNTATLGGGGGMFFSGTHTMTNSTVVGNHAKACRGGGLLFVGGDETLTNDTIDKNDAKLDGGNMSISTLNSLIGCLIEVINPSAARTATARSLRSQATDCSTSIAPQCYVVASVTVKNTIVSRGVPHNCAVAPAGQGYVSAKYNIDSEQSCQLNDPTDQKNVLDPKLGPLALNKGLTLNELPQPGSPAIDAVATANCPPPATDQRGVTRPQGPTGRCDIGADEVAMPVVSGVLPACVANGGTSVTVSGSGFFGATTVLVGSTPVTPVVAPDSNSLTFSSPSFTGTQDVTVVGFDGTSAVNSADTLAVCVPPTPPKLPKAGAWQAAGRAVNPLAGLIVVASLLIVGWRSGARRRRRPSRT